MRKKIEWEWEYLENGFVTGTRRAKVIGGWIVHNYSHADKKRTAESMVFVPDRDHEWAIAPKIVEKAAIKTALAKDFDVPKPQA
jgi:hypothetical protein